MIDFKSVIRNLGSISEPVWEDSQHYFKPVSLEKGEVFLKAGEICTKAAFISSGILRTFYYNEKDEEITYCFCEAGKFSTAFQSFIEQTPSKLSIQALVPSELFVIEYADLQTLYQNFPEWQQTGRILVEREFLQLEKYASSLNLETAKEKYLRLAEQQPLVIQFAPVQYIASYLGVSRETLSRIRSQIL
ncbi:MAG: cyclic nucleotide-binding protein [Bacteroidetes bacterium]|jgi:CRP-like cAMP-binding protein|nr:cyclic nucleotide-binding protein [Bacteroidota bacterium]